MAPAGLEATGCATGRIGAEGIAEGAVEVPDGASLSESEPPSTSGSAGRLLGVLTGAGVVADVRVVGAGEA